MPAKPDRRTGEQQQAAVADAVADDAERDLQDHVAEADHGQQQCGIGLRIADAVAVDRKQRETAGLDGAEHQHRRGRGRHQPDIAPEADRLLVVDGSSGFRRRPPAQGWRPGCTSTKVTPNGRKPALPILANSQGPKAKPSDSTVA